MAKGVIATSKCEFKHGEFCEIVEAPCEIANPQSCGIRESEIERRKEADCAGD